jgi:hypothetical protein
METKKIIGVKRVAHGDVIKPNDALYVKGRLTHIYQEGEKEIGEKVNHNWQNPIYREIEII